MTLVYLIVGISVGLVIGWLGARSKVSSGDTSLRAALEAAEREKAAIQARFDLLTIQVTSLQGRLDEEQNKAVQSGKELSSALSDASHVREQLASQQAEVERLHQEMSVRFENLANKIFEDKSQKFVDQNRTNLDVILNPLKDKIKEFETRVDQAFKTESQERNTLRVELKSLMELNQRMSQEADNLTRALKGDTKRQGNWGEFVLEKILDSSGLEKGREYETQVTYTAEDGRKYQPDVIIHFPDNKHIIVDSKVSLVAYDAFTNADSDADRERFLREHLTSVRNHIKGLSEKAYERLPGITSPDFVLLFMPIESSFGAAVKADQELFQFAWDRRIVLVSPSTLLASLRTISSVWKQDRQTRNALEIARVGGALYDKFKGFVDDLIDVGKKMDQSKVSYNEAMNKLVDGQGNIVRRVEELKKLGARTSKELPAALLDRAQEDVEG
ncbi:MAG: DNA recombination protein RmuC [Bacteroidota bacterium]